MSVPSLPQLSFDFAFSATNAPHSIWVTVTSTLSFLSDSWITRVRGDELRVLGRALDLDLEAPVGVPGLGQELLGPLDVGLEIGERLGVEVPVAVPVGTGPEGTPAPKTAFWMTSLVSTAIRRARRTRASLSGLFRG